VEAALEASINWKDLFVRSEDRLKVAEELDARGVINGFQFLAYKRGGEEFYLDWTCTALRGDDRRIVEYNGTFRDVTEKKRLEEAILESREYLNRIISQTPLAVQVFDANGFVMDVNEAWLRLFGAQSKDSLIGLNILKSRFVQNHEIKPYVNAAFKGASVDIPPFTLDPSTARSVKLSGTERTIHAKLFPVFDRNEKLVNVVAMIEDVTEKRKLEEQLLQSQKMESIGLLAGGIAHDFNNILGGILGYSSYLKTVVNKDDKIFSHLETIERSALRAAELTSKLLAFARGGKYVVRPIDINAVIDETIRLLRGSMDKSIIIEATLAQNLPATEADAGQMQQVLMNLCVNARDAMPGGGKITIVSELLSRPEEILAVRHELSHHSYIRISISDTGIGIDKAVMNRIFEPFFTTKEKGKGTGLGLATVYGIVKNHGGFLDVESEVGVGTAFILYLPAVEKEAVVLETPSHDAEGGDETILIVDDEEVIRSLAREILESKGYSVLEAADGTQAIEVYSQHGNSIDLIILDMAMPMMSGSDTFARLHQMNKNLRVILSTGYAEDDRARKLMAQGVKAFVQKPYKVEEFATVVRRVLDGVDGDATNGNT
ncbi:MAG: response regulator, partial [Ignavibacteriae bacterium]|nr:response regulator [Ignavibacteriota bacterium]